MLNSPSVEYQVKKGIIHRILKDYVDMTYVGQALPQRVPNVGWKKVFLCLFQVFIESLLCAKPSGGHFDFFPGARHVSRSSDLYAVT